MQGEFIGTVNIIRYVAFMQKLVHTVEFDLFYDIRLCSCTGVTVVIHESLRLKATSHTF